LSLSLLDFFLSCFLSLSLSLSLLLSLLLSRLLRSLLDRWRDPLLDRDRRLLSIDGDLERLRLLVFLSRDLDRLLLRGDGLLRLGLTGDGDLLRRLSSSFDNARSWVVVSSTGFSFFLGILL